MKSIILTFFILELEKEIRKNNISEIKNLLNKLRLKSIYEIENLITGLMEDEIEETIERLVNETIKKEG